MSMFGKIAEFEPDTEDWLQYVKRLKFYFTASKISENVQKRAFLLTVIGPSVYDRLRSLVSLQKPGKKSFTDLVNCWKGTTG